MRAAIRHATGKGQANMDFQRITVDPRQMAGVPCITTITGAAAAVDAIRAVRTEDLDVRPLQDYYASVAAT